MKRVVLAMLVTAMIPLTAAAQDAATPAVSGTDTSASAAPAEAAQPTATPRPAKRRGSMVGYVEDASIGPKVRVRFDSGWDVESPDRAEFFYAKCGCYRDLAGTDLYDPDAPGPGPGVLQGLNYSQFSVLGEIGVRDRLSFFAELPLRSIRPTAFAPGSGSFDSAFGLGDISAGVKWSFFSDESTDVTMMMRGSFPSGDAGKGLGTHHGSLEPAFLVHRDLGDRAGLEGEFGFWTPLSSSKGPRPATDGQFASSVMYYGFGPSFDLVKTDRGTLSPVIELVAWHVFLGYQTSTLFINGGQANAIDIANLKLGARYTMKGKDSIYVGVGFALTDSDWYGKILRLEYRRGF